MYLVFAFDKSSNDLLLLQALKAQEAALSDSEDRDDMDIADGGGKDKEDSGFAHGVKVVYFCAGFFVPLCPPQTMT